jgi:hypothetical protein
MQSLRKRPTYNEVVDYLENEQPKIKYPDRTATFLRNSPYLSQFDGDSWIDLEEQEQAMNKERIKQITLRELAASRGETHQMLSARTQRYSIASETPSEGYDSAVIDFLSDIEHDQNEREETRQGVLSRGRDMISRMLGQTEEQVARPEFLPQEQTVPLLEYRGTPYASATPTQESLPPLEPLTSSSSSSSKPSPFGLNQAPMRTTTPEEVMLKSMKLEEIKSELKKLGVSVKGTSDWRKSDWIQLLMSERRKKK